MECDADQMMSADWGLCIDCGGIDACVEDGRLVKVEEPKDRWLVKLRR